MLGLFNWFRGRGTVKMSEEEEELWLRALAVVPILQGLIGSGMGKGPALALLLAGPALSLPSMLVINSVLGVKKTATFVGLVIVMATFSGLLYGSIF